MEQDEPFWVKARRQILRDPDRINLNAGTLSPTPAPVFEAVTALRRRMAENPSDFHWRQSQPLLEAARTRLAGYLRCRTQDLLLLTNTTYAMNCIVRSLDLPAGSEILITDHEYGAVIHLWQQIARERGWTLRLIGLPYRSEDPAELVDAFQRAISPATRLVSFSHVACTTGLVLPAAELTVMLRNRGMLVLIDGAHAPGMVPVDLTAIGADFYVGNCHKWLMAPAGAAFLHAEPQCRRMLKPLVVSWGVDYDPANADAFSGYCGTFQQWDLESDGTTDRTPQMVLPECLDLRDALGGDAAIFSRVRGLSDYTRRALAACGLTAATPENPRLSGAMTAFDFPCRDRFEPRDFFWHEHRVECPITVAAGKSFLRVSTGWFNTIAEIDRLCQAVTDWRRRRGSA